MDVSSILYLVILVVLSGIFSSLEIAFFSLSDAKIDVMINNKKRGAKMVKKLKSNPEKLLTTILIGNNIVNILAASIATQISINLFGNTGVAIATFVMTIIILIVGEIIPKAVATAYASHIAKTMSFALIGVQWLFFPIIHVLETLTKWFLKVLKVEKKISVSDDELKAMAKIGVEEGSIEKNEHLLIRNALRFNDIEAWQIMTPRVKMVTLDCNSTIEKSLPVIKSCNFSRIPVYENNDDNIIGIFYVRDILALSEADFKYKKVKDMISKPLFTSETKKIDTLFKEFQTERTHIAIVLDEHGGTAGLITLEDIIEELVGEISDETDTDFNLIRKINKDIILADGEAELKQVMDTFEMEYPNETDINQSLNGFICDMFEDIPKGGSEIEWQGLFFKVEEVSEKMIQKVRIYKKSKLV